MATREGRRLLRLFERLLGHFGPQGWWPAETPWEVMVGAILTQNTAWTNVERAINNLKEADMLSIEAIDEASTGSLARLIRPSGYFNQKAARLKDLASYVVEAHGGRLDHLFDRPTDEVRTELLGLKGIGPETADAIMLYAGDHLTFVIDAYTLRFARRYPMPFEPRYGPAREYFQAHLPRDLYVYQELHALLDELAKRYCRPRPTCKGCPVREGCSHGR